VRASRRTEALSGSQRAAIVLRAVPATTSGLVRARLTFTERRLIDFAGQQIDELPDEIRVEVMNQLGVALSPHPPKFPTVGHHRQESCPFRFTRDLVTDELVQLLELEDPLAAAVALSHVGPATSQATWKALSTPRRDTIVRALTTVPTVGMGKTALFAERMESRYRRWPARVVSAR